MIKIELKNRAKEVVCQIKLPANAGELPLANYVSFLAEADKVGRNGYNSVRQMAKAVAEFSGEPVEKVMKAQFGDDWDGQDAGQIEGIKAMFGWCVDVVGGWKGELRGNDNHRFEYDGETFEIPIIGVQAIGGRVLPDIEVNEAIEAFETVRLFGDQITKGATVRECVGALKMTKEKQVREPYEKRLKAMVKEAEKADLSDYETLDNLLDQHGDESGNMAYSRYLTMMAILCRKPGETLPEKDSEKQRFIAARAAHFQGIDTKTALDVDFFLLTTFNALGMIQPVFGSLIRPLIGPVVETRNWNVKPMPGRLSTTAMFTHVWGGKR